MRLKRSNRKRKKQRFAAYRAASLAALTMYGIGQLVTPTHALLIARSQNQSNFSTAFVFPKTVQDIAARAGQAANEASNASSAAQSALQSCNAVDSTTGKHFLQDAQHAASLAHQKTSDAASVVSELAGYATHSQNDLNVAQSTLDNLQNQHSALSVKIVETEKALQSWKDLFDHPSIQTTLNDLHKQQDALKKQIAGAESSLASYQRVNAYVQVAYQEAQASAAQTNQSAATASQFAAQAAECVDKKAAAEKAAAEKAAAEKAAADKAAADKAAADKAAADKAASDQSSSGQIPSSQSPTGHSATGQSATGQSPSDQSASDKVTTEQTTIDQPAIDSLSDQKTSTIITQHNVKVNIVGGTQ